jgi:hypothetical protein
VRRLRADWGARDGDDAVRGALNVLTPVEYHKQKRMKSTRVTMVVLSRDQIRVRTVYLFETRTVAPESALISASLEPYVRTIRADAAEERKVSATPPVQHDKSRCSSRTEGARRTTTTAHPV